MIGRLGDGALLAGMPIAMGSALLWLRVAQSRHSAMNGHGIAHRNPALPRAAGIASAGCLAAAVVAVFSLEFALLHNDFTISYVAENGGRDVPVFYTVTSLWAAMDGSLLLWLLILTGYGALLARNTLLARGRGRPTGAVQPLAMTVHSVVVVFFFALSYFGANPFQAVSAPPSDGPGPSPLLREHPAMGLHPPLLYAGYLGLAIPFGYAVAALVTGATGNGWIRRARPWLVVAWTCLTTGIVLGAWWSYAVLGWGGYWAWDPVENMSMVPWLTATALLHLIMVQSRTVEGRTVEGRTVEGQTGEGRTAGDDRPVVRIQLLPAALACLSFLLVLLGTFLTRSGTTASVHTFAVSPLGWMLLGFVLLTGAVVTGLLVWRATDRNATDRDTNDRDTKVPGGNDPTTGAQRSDQTPVAALSRETTLLGNGVLLVTLAAVVLTGTLFPLFTEALTGTRSAVGPPYFSRTAVPVILLVLLLMAVAPLVRPGGDQPRALARRLAVPAGFAAVTITAVGLVSRPGVSVLLAFGAAAFVLATSTARLTELLRKQTSGSVLRQRRRYAGVIAHVGLAIAAIGIAGSSGYTRTVERQLHSGDSLTVAGVTAQLAGVRTAGGTETAAASSATNSASTAASPAATSSATAELTLRRGSDQLGPLRPTLRHYAARDMTVAVPAIRSRPTGDVYATLTGVDDTGTTATVRLAVNPLVPLIWGGGAIIAAAGLLALGRRR